MKRLLNLILILSVCLYCLSCSKNDDSEINHIEKLEMRTELSNKYPALGELVEVNLRLTNGSIASVQYNWGDGTITLNENNSHKYLTEGKYTINVIAKDIDDTAIMLSHNVEIEGVGLTTFVKDFNHNNVLITAHRGRTGDNTIPENSIVALDAVIANKFAIDFMELDPRPTKDGVYVIMHDATVDRTTDGTGKLSDLTYEQVKKLKLKLADGTITNQSVPTLEDMLMRARGKVFLNIDCTDKISIKDAYDLTQKYGMLDRVLFTIGSNKEILKTSLDYNKTIFILGQYSNDGDDSFFESVGGKDRVPFVYITPAKALSTTYPDILHSKGFISSTLVLDQNGYTYDTQIQNGDFRGVDMILNRNYKLIQSDHPVILHNYLKSIGKR